MCPPGPRACARGRQKAGRCAGRTGRRAARPHAACDPEGSRRPRAICWHTPAPWCKTTSFIKKKKATTLLFFKKRKIRRGSRSAAAQGRRAAFVLCHCSPHVCVAASRAGCLTRSFP